MEEVEVEVLAHLEGGKKMSKMSEMNWNFRIPPKKESKKYCHMCLCQH